MTIDVIIYDFDHLSDGEWKTYYHVSKTDYDLCKRIEESKIPEQLMIRSAHCYLLVNDIYEREVYVSFEEAIKYATELADRNIIKIHWYSASQKVLYKIYNLGVDRDRSYKDKETYIYHPFKHSMLTRSLLICI